VDARLARAFANPDPDAGLRAARELARTLQARHPGAAASLRESLEEMFTSTGWAFLNGWRDADLHQPGVGVVIARGREVPSR